VAWPVPELAAGVEAGVLSFVDELLADVPEPDVFDSEVLPDDELPDDELADFCDCVAACDEAAAAVVLAAPGRL
jgi:hypothetical protein